ncbi:nucleotide exchange factor GrpE [Parabacteroides distasonis]|nr:nucleotide exchange factor GrpE [Parabacteroides distasonis]
MDTKNPKETEKETANPEEMEQQKVTNLQDNQTEKAEETTEQDKVADDLTALQQKYEELNDTHLRLRAEFDNYRKRTMREKADLIKMGGESALKNLLPVIDDFERALQNIRATEEMDAIREGVDLIYTKFINYLGQQGVKAIEAVGKPFDTEEFEAIATIPAPQPDMKGKVIDCVQTGYILYDKVLRHARVVVGE